jgi:hypothetical protein
MRASTRSWASRQPDDPGGRKGKNRAGRDFKRFQDARTAEIFNELAERSAGSRVRRRSKPSTRSSSFYLHFSEFEKAQLKAESLEDIEAAFGGETEFDVPINPYSVVFEFARQLVQLRETNSITETTFAEFAPQVLAWLNRALKSLRIVANSLSRQHSTHTLIERAHLLLHFENHGLESGAVEDATSLSRRGSRSG